LTRKDNRRPLLEPRQRVDPVAASSSLPLSSVRRELSGFEVIENARPIRNPPLCSKCHILGHARNSKECPLRYSELRALPVVSSDQPQTCSEIFSGYPLRSRRSQGHQRWKRSTKYSGNKSRLWKISSLSLN
jgi:hypothetical protein